MGAFELKDAGRGGQHNNFGDFNSYGHSTGNSHNVGHGHGQSHGKGKEPIQSLDLGRLREENLIALKIYDSCRRQDCLTMGQLGPARAAECGSICGHPIKEGDIICPPHDAASVSIDKLKVKRVLIVDKEHNSFKRGYWDIELKFVFEYRLIFREADGCIAGSIKAHSIYNKKVTLFGSEGADLFMATDLFRGADCDNMFGNEPYVQVEAKAMSLGAELCLRHGKAKEVAVTIGLFFITKLFRVVDLRVESRGFAIPKECSNNGSVDPCDFFDKLAFPMDVFSPPQKPEFFAGVSGDIPASKHHKEHEHDHHHDHGHHHHHGHHDKKHSSCCD